MFCNFTAQAPGDWSCDNRTNLTAPLPIGTSLGVKPRPVLSSNGGKSRALNCHGKQHPWMTWPSEAPPARCPAGSKGDRTCTPFERSTDLLGLMFNGCSVGHGFGFADRGSTFPALDVNSGGTGADT